MNTVSEVLTKKGRAKLLTLDTLVASSTHVRSWRCHLRLAAGAEGARNLFLFVGLHCGLRSNGLGLAIDDLAIFNRSLNKPMLLVVAEIATVSAVLAKVKIAIITDTAVPVCVGYSTITVVAANCEVGTS